MKYFYVYAIVLILLTGSVYDASAQSTYTYKQPQSLDDGLLVKNLLSQKTDETLIDALFNKLAHMDHDVHSTLLIKDGALLIEEYFSDHSMDTHMICARPLKVYSLC